MIFANAHPKCGTNLIKKTLGGFGIPHTEGGLIRYAPAGPLFLQEGCSWAMLDKIGDGSFLHTHLAYGSLPAGNKLVNCIRHPRNALYSFLRWSEGREKSPFGVNEDSAVHVILQGMYDQAPAFTKTCMYFGLWAKDSSIVSVRFEDICSDGGESVARIAKYVGADPDLVPKVYEGLYGNGKQIDGQDVYKGRSTWTGDWSDWERLWTPKIERAWKAAEGPAIEDALGYEV